MPVIPWSPLQHPFSLLPSSHQNADTHTHTQRHEVFWDLQTSTYLKISSHQCETVSCALIWKILILYFSKFYEAILIRILANFSRQEKLLFSLLFANILCMLTEHISVTFILFYFFSKHRLTKEDWEKTPESGLGFKEGIGHTLFYLTILLPIF